MPQFHGTYQIFAPGQVLTATRPSQHYPEAVAQLELHRPATAPSRGCCLFATDSLAGAAAFIQAQSQTDGSVPRFYEVNMPVAHRGPFCLIHEIARRLKDGREIDSVVREYWEPAQQWVFWEEFGPSLTVLREVPAPADGEVMRFRWLYDRDSDRARRTGT